MPHDYVDDETIVDEAQLWRRVHPMWVIPDGNQGRMRLTRQAFQNRKGTESISVLLAELTGKPTQVLSEFPGYGLASLTAGFARAASQIVVRDPTPDEAAHALVVGRKTDATQRQLAKSAILVVAPPQASEKSSTL
ncbi:MAG: hypothetical protein GEU28_11610 [Dehalococcoidia bacterium]|nr:hypothetical protein [Dehalococcoidia bacterium]